MLGVIEVVTMLAVVIGVDEGRAAKPRDGRSWLAIAADAWGTDILRERSFVFLVGSRLFVLMGGAVLVKLGLLYLERSHGSRRRMPVKTLAIVAVIVATATALAVIPAGRASDRFGRKRVIYVATAVGAAGLLTEAVAPTLPIAYLGAALMGIGTGSFLAVDWALMTDIIPKASSGRYMGISNVATASAGVFAIAIGGGLIMDRFPGETGPRAACSSAPCPTGSARSCSARSRNGGARTRSWSWRRRSRPPDERGSLASEAQAEERPDARAHHAPRGRPRIGGVVGEPATPVAHVPARPRRAVRATTTAAGTRTGRAGSTTTARPPR